MKEILIFMYGNLINFRTLVQFHSLSVGRQIHHLIIVHLLTTLTSGDQPTKHYTIDETHIASWPNSLQLYWSTWQLLRILSGLHWPPMISFKTISFTTSSSVTRSLLSTVRLWCWFWFCCLPPCSSFSYSSPTQRNVLPHGGPNHDILFKP